MTTEARERQLLEAIVESQRQRGYLPTRRELAAVLRISTTRVQQLVDGCVAKGTLTRRPRAARAFVVNPLFVSSARGVPAATL
jgi:SOS-response transcriptional repressor LexA